MQTIISSHDVEDVAQIALRVPASLRDMLKAGARRYGRSMNTHVVMMLKEAMERADDTSSRS